MKKRMISLWLKLTWLLMATLLLGCSEPQEAFSDLEQLHNRTFAVPTGTIADQLVLSRFPQANFQYFNTVVDAALAVKNGRADAAAYDEPILRNIAAKTSGVRVLPQLITEDHYGFAVRLGDEALKGAVDAVVDDLRANGDYQRMMERWLPAIGSPAAMPAIPTGSEGILRFGTAAITEPFSFVDGSQQVVGIDIEIASLVAQRLNRKLEVVNMDFGGLIPALAAGKVDMIGACITISQERARQVLFSKSYYTGGIAALVRE
ncbi:MAG: transporter substrate-binding domain-containing protein [Porticoccaceae bacterium]|nr:transporter substrate-binding domain-containing protein [Porticoccaceae bacterium]